MPKNYSDYPLAHAMKPYVPQTFTPGQPVKVSRALYKKMEWHDAFRLVHGMAAGDAMAQGLITLTNEPPAAPASGNGQQ